MINRSARGALVAVLMFLALCPGAAQAAPIDLIGQNDLGGQGLNGEVATVGDTAVVGSGILGAAGVRSSFYSTYSCPATTVKVVDLSRPSSPNVAATIPVPNDAVASDVDAIRVRTPAFTGDLAAVALVRCNFAGNFVDRGVAYYDVTNRSDPRFLGRYDADQNLETVLDPPCGPPPPNANANRCAASQDQVALVQRPSDGKVLSLSTEPFASNSQSAVPQPNEFHGDLRVVDVTDPTDPTEIASYPNGPDRFPGSGTPTNRIGASNNGCRAFDSGYGPAAYPDGSKALLTYFDQGLVTVNVGDPTTPQKLGQYQYPRDVREIEGNAGYVEYTRAGARDLALMAETDWIGPNSTLRIDAPAAIAGSKFACEAMFTLFDPENTAQVYRQPGSQIPGQIVYVGRGCPETGTTPAHPYLGDPAGQIAFIDRTTVASRQPGLVGNCTAAAAIQRAQDAGAKGVVIGNANAATPQAVSLDGDPPPGLDIPAIMIDTGDAEQLRDALCPAPTPPAGGCAAGGQQVTGAMVDRPGEWGALRVVDTTNPVAPDLRGVYRPPTSRVFPPPDLGVYAVHHAVGRGSTAYVAGHANGLRVLDLRNANPTEIASFVPPDTPDPTDATAIGRPDNVPAKANVVGVDVTPRGDVVISDVNSGLYVLRVAQSPGSLVSPQPVAAFADCPTATANVIRGSAVGERLNGTPRADRIFAGTGNDIVDGLAADDCIDLGPGTDRGQGGDGSDLILGGLGPDRISGNVGGDRLRGGSSADRLNGGFGDDRLHGQSGGDRLSGERGRDRINGGSSNDLISAGSSGDRVAGDQGGDRINGNSGNDTLRGNSGRDRIKGSSGRDRLSGGSGNDRIAARDGQRDRVNCGTGRDRVSADRIDRVARNCERVARPRS